MHRSSLGIEDAWMRRANGTVGNLLVVCQSSGLAITGGTARLPPVSGLQRNTQLIKRKGLTHRRPFEAKRFVMRDSVSRRKNNPEFRTDGRRASRQFGA